jgi:hypothetical protein
MMTIDEFLAIPGAVIDITHLSQLEHPTDFTEACVAALRALRKHPAAHEISDETVFELVRRHRDQQEQLIDAEKAGRRIVTRLFDFIIRLMDRRQLEQFRKVIDRLDRYHPQLLAIAIRSIDEQTTPAPKRIPNK